LVGKQLGIVLFVFLSILFSQEDMPGNSLAVELGCGNCHSGVSSSETIKIYAPDLNYAGSKYNAAFLYDYILNPKKIRQHIGRSRMPDFGFSEDESLALTLFLMSKSNLPPNHKLENRKTISGNNGFNLIHNEYQCTACHTLNDVGVNKSIDLNMSGLRHQEEWLYDVILQPSVYLHSSSPMPSFFEPDDSSSENIIGEMVRYLLDLSDTNFKVLDQKFDRVKRAYPNITKEMGRDIYASQNCSACHSMDEEERWFETHNAPNLTHQRMKTPSSWLVRFLKEPSPVRPNGFFPGTGSRMPNFNLTEAEIGILSDWLGGATSKTKLNPISAFQTKKVERLLTDYLPCLGCHQLNGNGGKIGPDLSNVGNRLTDGFIKMAIQMPHLVTPESIMPKTILDSTLSPLVQSYFAQRESNKKSEYLNLIENRPYSIKNKYTANCAPCHGLKGDGTGFNAFYLPTKPGNFTDRSLMSLKADGSLFDTIHGGGRIMNKSHFMPAWGEKMSREEIVSYVRKIRDFCECDPPEWSND
jgi:mono/diheme cytochrome c family protein